ncbi:alpha/beta hydrolase [Kitasatospora sp. NPDC048365]|uniref:alpha/beta hydrolase n=1 Tax=Kitasatospora sp. NPDC048365 TaxID=3364050 RepID=UPI0037184063
MVWRIGGVAVAAEVVVRTGLTYGAAGKLMDVYRPAGASEPVPAVLLWHGRGPDERDVLAPVARAAAGLGVVVLVPDWRPDAPDGGRTHLRESADFVRRNAADFGGDPRRIVLAGWSLGGKAAVGVALNPAAFLDWRPQAVVGIAGGYGSAAPTTGTVPIDDLRLGGSPVPPVPVWLVHGTADPVVDVERSRELRTALEGQGRPVSLIEVATDHAGVIMTEFVAEHGRCLPSTADHAVEAGSRTADLLARAAGITAQRLPVEAGAECLRSR